MNVIFCRHGETQYNLEDKFQGVCDSPLTTKGIEQAQAINKVFREVFHVEKFLRSPLPRAQQTAAIMSYGITTDVQVLQDLRELCYGEWEEKKREDISPTLLEERSKDRFNFVHPGRYKEMLGESYHLQYQRLLPLFKKLESMQGGKDIVIVSHHGVMISVLKYFQNLSDQEAGQIKNPNDQIVVIDTSKQRGEDGYCRIVQA